MLPPPPLRTRPLKFLPRTPQTELLVRVDDDDARLRHAHIILNLQQKGVFALHRGEEVCEASDALRTLAGRLAAEEEFVAFMDLHDAVVVFCEELVSSVDLAVPVEEGAAVGAGRF